MILVLILMLMLALIVLFRDANQRWKDSRHLAIVSS